MGEQEGVKRYSTEIVASEMQMLDGRTGPQEMTDNAFGQNQRPTEPIQSEGQPKAAQPASFDNFDDDIPF